MAHVLTFSHLTKVLCVETKPSFVCRSRTFWCKTIYFLSFLLWELHDTLTRMPLLLQVCVSWMLQLYIDKSWTYHTCLYIYLQKYVCYMLSFCIYMIYHISYVWYHTYTHICVIYVLCLVEGEVFTAPTKSSSLLLEDSTHREWHFSTLQTNLKTRHISLVFTFSFIAAPCRGHISRIAGMCQLLT